MKKALFLLVFVVLVFLLLVSRRNGLGIAPSALNDREGARDADRVQTPLVALPKGDYELNSDGSTNWLIIQPLEFRGVVLDQDDHPISGAEVFTSLNPGNGTAGWTNGYLTDSSGSIVVTGGRGGGLLVTAKKAGYISTGIGSDIDIDRVFGWISSIYITHRSQIAIEFYSNPNARPIILRLIKVSEPLRVCVYVKSFKFEPNKQSLEFELIRGESNSNHTLIVSGSNDVLESGGEIEIQPANGAAFGTTDHD